MASALHADRNASTPRRGDVILTDGALGTEYQRLGLPPGALTDLWVLEAPDKVYEVTRSYVLAGSDAVLTTTFRANGVTLRDYGRASDTRAINRAAAAIARDAAGPGTLVFGDAGPSGKMHQVTGYDLQRGFAQQCEALAEGGVDAIVFETFSDLAEAKIALNAGRSTGLPVIVSFSFHTGGSDQTVLGVTPEQAAQELSEAGAYAVGANCGDGFRSYVSICARLAAATALPIWIKPNRGLPEVVNGTLTYRSTPEEFASSVKAYIEAGATFIGGCCGTTPDFIRAAAAVINDRPRNYSVLK
jgi:5-methyltetrahydrofolate--homocysteine methyltransferase